MGGSARSVRSDGAGRGSLRTGGHRGSRCPLVLVAGPHHRQPPDPSGVASGRARHPAWTPALRPRRAGVGEAICGAARPSAHIDAEERARPPQVEGVTGMEQDIWERIRYARDQALEAERTERNRLADADNADLQQAASVRLATRQAVREALDDVLGESSDVQEDGVKRRPTARHPSTRRAALESSRIEPRYPTPPPPVRRRRRSAPTRATRTRAPARYGRRSAPPS